MPRLIPTEKFLEDIEAFKFQKETIRKIAKALSFLEANPHHPGLNLERIVNDPTAWSVHVNRRYRIFFDPDKFLDSRVPDWSGNIVLLPILSHDDLYKGPR
ncbi:MAG: hypothetical protein ACP5IL_17145 [Syntrophobacteraceae bacterium]